MKDIIIDKLLNEKFHDINWIFLIVPNSLKIIEDKYVHRFYKLIIMTLKIVVLLKEDYRKLCEEYIKVSIQDLFGLIYENGIEFILSQKLNNNIFLFIRKILSKIDDEYKEKINCV